MQAREVMTPDPVCCTPSMSAQGVACLMRENDCGAIPVVERDGSRKLVGVVTDRDIAVRGVADGHGTDTPVQELMTAEPQACQQEDDVRQVEEVMKRNRVRRVPIIDTRGLLVGIIAQADLARRLDDSEEVAEVVERISEPGQRVHSAQAD